MATPKSKKNPESVDPFRKRSFDPRYDVALMMIAFEGDNPGTKVAWHLNQAVREYLTKKGYEKQLPKLKSLFPLRP